MIIPVASEAELRAALPAFLDPSIATILEIEQDIPLSAPLVIAPERNITRPKVISGMGGDLIGADVVLTVSGKGTLWRHLSLQSVGVTGGDLVLNGGNQFVETPGYEAIYSSDIVDVRLMGGSLRLEGAVFESTVVGGRIVRPARGHPAIFIASDQASSLSIRDITIRQAKIGIDSMSQDVWIKDTTILESDYAIKVYNNIGGGLRDIHIENCLECVHMGNIVRADNVTALNCGGAAVIDGYTDQRGIGYVRGCFSYHSDPELPALKSYIIKGSGYLENKWWRF